MLSREFNGITTDGFLSCRAERDDIPLGAAENHPGLSAFLRPGARPT